MAEALTIALLLEARDNASEWIDRVRENIDQLAEQAQDASKVVADSADQMTTALEGTDEASNTAADSMDRQTAASTESAAALRDQAAAATDATAATDETAASTATMGDTAEASAGKMGLLTKAAGAVGLALIGVGVVSAKLAIDYQESTATLAGQAGITVDAANKISQAFLAAGGQTTFTSNQMMQAFSPVAGEFVNMYGQALNASKAMTVMNASMTLAEAGGGDLTTTTKALADTMMVFHLKVSQASSAANILFNTSRLLGVSTDTLGQTITRLEPKIAGSGMSLKQLTGFMVEFAKSAGGGRSAVRLAGTFIQSLVAPSQSAVEELATLGINVDNSKGKFIGLQQVIGKLHDALAKLPGTANLITESQKAYKLQMQESTLATEPQTKAVLTQEQAISQQVSALHNANVTLSKTTVLQELFGKNAALAAQMIAEGTPAYEQATKAVAKQGEAAKAAAEQEKTFHGMLERLKSAAETIFIELGQKLLPVLVKVAEWTIRIVNAIMNWVTHNQTLSVILLGVVGAIVAVIEAIKIITVLTKAWAAAQAILDVLLDANPIGLIVLAVLALITAIVLLVLNWKHVEDAAVDAWHAIEDAWGDVASWFDSEVIQPIVNFFTNLWESIAGPAIITWNALVAIWGIAASWFDSTVIQPIVNFFKDLWDTLSTAASVTWQAIVAVWDVASSWFDSEVVDPIERFFVALWDDVESAAVDGWHGVVSAWDVASSWFDSEIIQPIERFFEALWDDLTSAAVAAWHGVVDAWDAASSWFDSEVIDPIERFFVALWNDLASGAETAWHGVVAVWDAVAAWFDSTVIQPIESFFKTLWDDITGGATTAANTIKSVFSDVGSALNTATGGVLGDLGSLIPHLAAGGVVNSPTLAVVGEAGPEMIIPLSTLPGGASALGGSGVSALPSLGASSSGGTVVQVNLTMAGQVYGDINQALNAMGRQLATILVPGAGTRLTTR